MKKYKEQLSKADIKRACDILRRDDGVGPGNYVEQLSWLLFLRVFERVEKELKELTEAEGKRYKDIIEKEYRWSSWAKKDWKDKDELIHFINKKLFPHLRSLKGTREKEKVADVFRELDGNKIRSPYTLLDVVDILDEINMSHFQDTHLLSHVYEEILQEMGSENGWSGEFYTPRPIIRLMIKIINPKLGETIMDPFVGSGGFLVETFDYISQNIKMGVKKWDILQNKTFSGQEKKPLPYLIGTMNMMLHGILVPNLARTNTLMEDVHNVPESSKVDIILTNPPFGGQEHKIVQNNFPVAVAATEGLALQYVMRKLKNGGRCGIVLPEGQILFGGRSFQQIREELLQKFNVHTIISLPQGVFASKGAGVKTNLVFFEKTGSTKEIWYGDMGGKFTKKQVVKDEHLEEVFKKWQNRELSKNTWVVTVDETKKRNFDLSPKNPNKAEEEELPEVKELIARIEKGEKEILENSKKLLQGELKKIFNTKLLKAWKAVELDKICDIFSGSSAPQSKKYFDPGGKPFVRVSDLGIYGRTKNLTTTRDKLSNAAIKEKRLVLAKKGTTLFPKSGAAILTNNRALLGIDAYVVGHLAALYPKEKVDSIFLYYLLCNIDMKNYVPNIGYPSLNLSKIKQIRILFPFKNNQPDLQEQKKIVNRLDKINDQAKKLEEKYQEQLKYFEQLKQSILNQAFQGKL